MTCGKEPTATPIENSFFSCAKLTEEQKIRFAAYQVFDMPKKASSKLEAAQRWIPVSERMPDNWESVLTIDISKSTRGAVTAFYNPETSLWSTHFSCDLWVTHWMPLPEPPIVYGKVCEE